MAIYRQQLGNTMKYLHPKERYGAKVQSSVWLILRVSYIWSSIMVYRDCKVNDFMGYIEIPSIKSDIFRVYNGNIAQNGDFEP